MMRRLGVLPSAFLHSDWLHFHWHGISVGRLYQASYSCNLFITRIMTGDKNFQHIRKYRFGRCPIMLSMFLQKFSVPVENEIKRYLPALFISGAKQDKILISYGVLKCTLILVGEAL